MADSQETVFQLGHRHGQLFLLFWGLAIAYALRADLSVGIVAMTDNSSNPNFPVINCTMAQKGVMLGSFFWGYIMTQLAGGLLSAKFGSVAVLSSSLMTCGISTMALPKAATTGGWMAVAALRAVQGVAQGVIFPSIFHHLSKWTVPIERSLLLSLVFGGTQLGSIVVLLLGGYLAASDWGWPSIFYISGGAGTVWSIIFGVWGSNSPLKHKTITIAERKFIIENLQSTSTESKELRVPWKQICLSVPFLAVCVASFAENWGFWTILILMPTYIDKALGFNIEDTGYLSSLPFAAMWLSSFSFGYIGNLIAKKNYLSVNAQRKFWNSLAHYGGAAALILLSFTLRSSVVICLLTIAVALNSAVYLGYVCSCLDLSPNFAGVLMGISNGFGNVGSILAPLVASWILSDDAVITNWRIVFLLAAAVFCLGNTIFIFFVSTDIQTWNEPVIHIEECDKNDTP